MTGGGLETAHEDLTERRVSLGRWLFRPATLLLVVVAALQALDSAGILSIGFTNWRPLLYVYILWGVALAGSQIPDTRGTRPADGVRSARAPLHARDGDLSNNLWALYRVHRLEPERRVRAPFQRPRQSADVVGQFLLLERARQHGVLCADRPRPIHDRFRACAVAERRYPRTQVLSRGVPAAIHAEPRRCELDDRQVAHGEPLRSDRDLRALSRMGKSRVFHFALDRKDQHHRHGQLGLDSVHGDLAARWTAGAAARGQGSGARSMAPIAGRCSGRSLSL